MKPKEKWYELKQPFLFMKGKDKRSKEAVQIKEKTGISPDETWDLDFAIALFLVPRLKMFKEKTIGIPYDFVREAEKNYKSLPHKEQNDKAMELWQETLDKMIYSFQWVLDEKNYEGYSKEEKEKVDEGLDLFRKHFFDLWW